MVLQVELRSTAGALRTHQLDDTTLLVDLGVKAALDRALVAGGALGCGPGSQRCCQGRFLSEEAEQAMSSPVTV